MNAKEAMDIVRKYYTSSSTFTEQKDTDRYEAAKDAVEQAFDDSELLRVLVENQWTVGKQPQGCFVWNPMFIVLTELSPTYQAAIQAAIAAKETT